jgi:GWxTD domain-containing protein
MFRFIAVGVVLFLYAPALLALDASVAHSVFFSPNKPGDKLLTPYVELYWQVNPKTVHFSTNADKMIVGMLKTDIRISKEKGLISEDHFILQTSPRSTVAELATLAVLDKKAYPITGGKITVFIKLTDVNDTLNEFHYTTEFEAAVDSLVPFFSDIALLDTIIRSDVASPFVKNGKQLVPICADFLDDPKRYLSFYTELYHSDAITASRYPLIVKVRVSKKINEAFFDDFSYIDTILKAGNVEVASGFPISKLTSGNYYLNATVEDRLGILICAQNRFFQRLNTHPEKTEIVTKPIKEVFKDTGMEHVTVLNLEKTFLAKYTLSQIRAILKMLLPMCDPMQTNTVNNFLKRPDEMYMRYFVYNYFQDINGKDPEKAWKQYSEIIKTVNKKFTEAGIAGYETDRGFIYIRYGKPSDVITISGETGSLPYEIWQYNTLTQFSNKKELANALFLFYKPSQMMSEYRILHSTVPGEGVNMSWRMYLYATNNAAANSGVNMNSRAEQYFGSR